MSWKVLIADDEPKIRRGLRGVFEELGPDYEVVAEAEDGEIALQQAELLRPDLLLIDVRMPILNGLELINRLAGVSGDWMIIVVTGHDEFEYAQAALRLHVYDLLLKPVVRETLVRTIRSAVVELSSRRENDRYLGWAKKELHRNSAPLQEDFLRRWLHGSLAECEIKDYADFLGVKIPPSVGIIACRLVERESSDRGFRRLHQFAMRLAVDKVLAQRFTPLHDGKGRMKTYHDLLLEQYSPLIFEDDSGAVCAVVWAERQEDMVAMAEDVEHEITTSVHVVPVVVWGIARGREYPLTEVYDAVCLELAGRDSAQPLVRIAQNCIERRYAEPELSLEQVADELKLSPGYVSRILRQETGFSFVDYLTRFRVKRATELLHDPANRVADVAEKVGYRSQHYFSRAFRKVLGVPPSSYKKEGHLQW